MSASEHMGVEVCNENFIPVTLAAGTVVGPIIEERIIEKLDLAQHVDQAQHSSCEGDGVVYVNLLTSVAESGLTRDVRLCETLELSELPVDLEQKDVVAKLVPEFCDVFVLTDSELGVTDRTCHYLEVKSHTSIKQYARCKPYVLRAPVKEAIDERKIIRPSSSPWVSPVMLVKKKGGKCRF